MTATQKFNDWGVPYSTIQFFCDMLDGHNKVDSYDRTQDILFEVKLTNGETIRVLLVREYSIGVAAILRAQKEFPSVEYIVTGGDWFGYTREAKKYGLENSIGIFTISEFMGALNFPEPKKYYRKDKDGKPVYSYKSSE